MVKKKNKKGWTTIVEVFISILLLAGLMTVILNSGAVKDSGKSEVIYKEQARVLKIVQLNDSLRDQILNGNLNQVEQTINNTMPNYLECKAKICVLNGVCDLDIEIDKEVYVKRVLITTNMVKYDPKELRLFCWEK